MSTSFVRNIEPFAVPTDGFLRVVRFGEIIETSDPVYKNHEHLFESVDDHANREIDRRKGVGVVPVVERMTAAPGEKREVEIPTPSTKDERPKAVPGYPCKDPDCDFASTSERGLKIHSKIHEDQE